MKKELVVKLGTSSLVAAIIAFTSSGCGDNDAPAGLGGAGGGGASSTGGSNSGGTASGGVPSEDGGAGGQGGMGGGGDTSGEGCEPPSLAAGPAVEIAGNYTSFDSPFVVESDRIVNFGTFHFRKVDNAAGVIIARNDEDNDYFPCAWSAFVWTQDDSGLYYCQSVYDAATESAALAAPLPDSANLASGCSGFGWSPLNQQ